jgi:hypothetical protein
MARYSSSRSSTKRVPKKPSLLSDVLDADDWGIIARYVELLRPCKEAAMLLQGHVGTATVRGTAVKGAIWQVLPVFESLMLAFKNARERHKPAETLASQRSEQANTQPSATSSSPTTPSPIPLRTIRSSQVLPITRTSAPTFRPSSQSAGSLADEQTTETSQTQGLSIDQSAESEKHFSTNINLGWQKLNTYFEKTDTTPIYRAAVVLHPRLKWRWFERYWESRPDWIAAAREAVAALWSEYKHAPLPQNNSSDVPSSPTAIHDEWSSPDGDQSAEIDQFDAYIDEPWAQVHSEQSPIPYWISKLTVWPQLAQMALDIYSTPACSDEPERVFSKGGTLLQPRRRQLTGEHVQEILCMESWQASGIVILSGSLFEQAVKATDGAPINDTLNNNNNTDESDGEGAYHRHEQ